MSIVFWIIVAAVVVGSLAGLWMVFEKAGEKGWKAIIPFYNCYVLIRISGHSGWWLALLLSPVVVILLGAEMISGSMEVAATNPNYSFPVLASLFLNGVILLLQVVIITSVVVGYDVARSFGKGLGFTIGLSVLPFIFLPILGFGKSEYRGPVAHPRMVAQGSGAHLPTPPASQEQEKKEDTPVEAKDSSSNEEKKENKKGEKEEKQADSDASNDQ
ncbi:MAG: DUF5684 domain-containing protein [Candidatus Paceibacterota bacterium]